MQLDVFFTQTEHEDQIWGSDGSAWAAEMREQMLRQSDAPHGVADSPEAADVIVFWEPHQDSQVIWAPRLRSHPLVGEFPNKVFTVSVEDSPLGFLPGLYTSLPERLYDDRRHRTWVFYRTENPFVWSRRNERFVKSPAKLASFIGAESHPVRSRLMRMQAALAEDSIGVESTQRGRFAPNPNDPRLQKAQNDFVDAILDSKFSLCPRGNGAGTYRLQESLALGRAPVIISDSWVPPHGPDWQDFAIFVKERDLGDLAAILRERAPCWAEMGRRASEAYDTFFKKETFAARAIDQMAGIFRRRTHDELDFFSRWDDLIEAERRRSKS